MNGGTIVLFIGATSICGVLLFASGADNRQKTFELDVLRAQLTALEQRVVALETRVERQVRPTNVLIPTTFPQIKKLPQGWEKRELNGMAYYIVPLLVVPNKLSQRTE